MAVKEGSKKAILDELTTQFDLMSKEARELYIGESIRETFQLPSAIEFLRNHVSKNLPLVIREANQHSAAVEKWNSQYFKKLHDKEVAVAVTPNGYADAITKNPDDGKEYFVMPEEVNMQMSDFLHALDDKTGPVLYIQRQNSNLYDFPELFDDLDHSILDFASEAFGKEPDAINFWMGDTRAITSMHKDPYENMFLVISGFKDFILIPPTDVHLVPRKKVDSAVYESNDEGAFKIRPLFNDDGTPIDIEWVSVDPLNPDLKKYPNYKKANVLKVRINAGDILYLPSLWYHHVQQSHKCIAVNYWFDMDYDFRYCTYKMMEQYRADE